MHNWTVKKYELSWITTQDIKKIFSNEHVILALSFYKCTWHWCKVIFLKSMQHFLSVDHTIQKPFFDLCEVHDPKSHDLCGRGQLAQELPFLLFPYFWKEYKIQYLPITMCTIFITHIYRDSLKKILYTFFVSCESLEVSTPFLFYPFFEISSYSYRILNIRHSAVRFEVTTLLTNCAT
jgi:hypothetical protein